MKYINENIVNLDQQEWFKNQQVAKISLLADLYSNQDNSNFSGLPSWLVNKSANNQMLQNYHQYKKYEPLFINEFNKLIYNQTYLINNNKDNKLTFNHSYDKWLTNDEYINKIIKVVINNNDLFINLLANKDVENTIDLIINNVYTKSSNNEQILETPPVIQQQVIANSIPQTPPSQTIVEQEKQIVDVTPQTIQTQTDVIVPIEEDYQEFIDSTTPIESKPSLTTTYASTKRKVDFIVNQNQSIMVKNINSYISVIDDLKIDLNQNWYLDQSQLNQLKYQQDDSIIKMVNEHQQALLFESNLYVDNTIDVFNKAFKDINIQQPINQQLINELNLVESDNKLLDKENNYLRNQIELIRQRVNHQYYEDQTIVDNHSVPSKFKDLISSSKR